MIYFVILDYDNVRKNKINKKSQYHIIVMCRAVHESSHPGFGPNPHLTRLGRVTEKLIRNQLTYGLDPSGRIISLNGSDHRFGGLNLLLGLSLNFIGFDFLGLFESWHIRLGLFFTKFLLKWAFISTWICPKLQIHTSQILSIQSKTWVNSKFILPR